MPSRTATSLSKACAMRRLAEVMKWVLLTGQDRTRRQRVRRASSNRVMPSDQTAYLVRLWQGLIPFRSDPQSSSGRWTRQAFRRANSPTT